MELTIGLAQCGFPADGDVVAQVARLAQEAASRGVDLLVFPEDLMSPRPLSSSELRALAQPLDGPFAQAVAASAREQRLWIAFTLYVSDPAGGAPFNVAAVVDDRGELRGSYRKCHLYDAHGVCESQRTQPGEELVSHLDTPFGRLGLGICYDLRFPEHARALALAGCQVVLYPAAWYAGPEKAAHWRGLLRARAIENELFVVGACRAGERYVGESLVADPLGRIVAEASGAQEELVVATIDTDEAAAARAAMPVLEHRRPELYATLCAPAAERPSTAG